LKDARNQQPYTSFDTKVISISQSLTCWDKPGEK
jgi:hypothetical protein